ncbi:hypothetical protein Scep_004482 [Stephania cephalantha]|uniref:HAT C-terminal dimerisation domain-containing protein n=1 Tax=Stephania cephalantha TaxID=152367 RepID=A0AAP0KTZ1_9MAGN
MGGKGQSATTVNWSTSMIVDSAQEFDEMSSNEFRCNSQKCQLELYLDEPKMPRHVKLDILDFWKSNQFRYPNLASMARDILSIPESTVASEASFSVGGRVLDQYRSSLKPENAEAIICLRDWICAGLEGQDGKLDLESITEDVLNLSVSDDPRSTTCSNSVGN